MYMHAYGKLQVGENFLSDLFINSVNSRLITLQDANGSGDLSSNDLKSRVHIKSYINIVYKHYSIKVDLLSNKISLPTGTICKYTQLECVDEEGYHNFWSPLFRKGCSRWARPIVYLGMAKKIQSKNLPTAYRLTHGSRQIIFFVHANHNVCNATVSQTEHPLFVTREVDENYLKKRKKINKFYSLIFVKPFQYVTDINLSMKDVYTEIGANRCHEKDAILRNSMALAHKDPSLFAYTLTGKPGYSARIRGEAAQLFQCTPVPAKPRTTGDCFIELPVTVDGDPMFLQPKTREISTRGTEIECDPLTTAMYKIKNQWYALTPTLKNLTRIPRALQPNSMPWGFDSTEDSIVEDLEDHSASQEITTQHVNRIFMIVLTICAIMSLAFVAIFLKGRKSRSRGQSSKEPPSYKILHHVHELPNSQEYAQDSVQLQRSSLEIPSGNSLTGLSLTDLPTRRLKELRLAYRDLEERIYNCMPRIQGELNKSTVASSYRCSKLKAGGVTSGASD